MTAHLVREYATSSHPLIDEYLHAEEPDESETGVLRGSLRGTVGPAVTSRQR